METTSYVWHDYFQRNLALGYAVTQKPYAFFKGKEASGAGFL